MQKKITELTESQKVVLTQYRQRWLEVGTSTERADHKKAEAAILEMYRRIGREQPAPVFIWCQSPATSLLAIEFLKSEQFKKLLGASLGDSLRASLGDSLRDSLRASLWDSLRASLRASLWDSLRASLGDSLRDSLRDSLWDSLWASLRASLRASLGDSLRDSLRASLGDSLRDSLRDSLWDSLRDAWWGQHESYWISFYLFCRDVVGVQYEEQKSKDLDLWRDIAESCCWWWPYQNYVIASERPTVVHMEQWQNRERLHCSDGPALAFADGWTVHALHGVRVSAEIVETPASELNPRLVLDQRNAEIRRELVRKIGIERICETLGGQTLDKAVVQSARRVHAGECDGICFDPSHWQQEPYTQEYELINLDLQDGRSRPYLKMMNPSISTYHLEGVHPSCRTVKDAINWRRYGNTKKEWNPSQLT